MTRVLTNDANDSLATNHLAVFADTFNTGTDFHNIIPIQSTKYTIRNQIIALFEIISRDLSPFFYYFFDFPQNIFSFFEKIFQQILPKLPICPKRFGNFFFFTLH